MPELLSRFLIIKDTDGSIYRYDQGSWDPRFGVDEMIASLSRKIEVVYLKDCNQTPVVDAAKCRHLVKVNGQVVHGNEFRSQPAIRVLGIPRFLQDCFERSVLIGRLKECPDSDFNVFLSIVRRVTTARQVELGCMRHIHACFPKDVNGKWNGLTF